MTTDNHAKQIPWTKLMAAAILLPITVAAALYAKELPENILFISGCMLTATGALLTIMAQGISWAEAEQMRQKRDPDVMRMCHSMALTAGVLSGPGVLLILWTTLFQNSVIDATGAGLLTSAFATTSGSLAVLISEKAVVKDQNSQQLLRTCRLTILACSPIATAGILLLCRSQLG